MRDERRAHGQQRASRTAAARQHRRHPERLSRRPACRNWPGRPRSGRARQFAHVAGIDLGQTKPPRTRPQTAATPPRQEGTRGRCHLRIELRPRTHGPRQGSAARDTRHRPCLRSPRFDVAYRLYQQLQFQEQSLQQPHNHPGFRRVHVTRHVSWDQSIFRGTCCRCGAQMRARLRRSMKLGLRACVCRSAMVRNVNVS